jgi:hypothetical protein
MRNMKKGTKRVSVNMAYRVARMACVPFDDLTSGTYPVPGTCPHCGRGRDAQVIPTETGSCLCGFRNLREFCG